MIEKRRSSTGAALFRLMAMIVITIYPSSFRATLRGDELIERFLANADHLQVSNPVISTEKPEAPSLERMSTTLWAASRSPAKRVWRRGLRGSKNFLIACVP
jgi:hypothetical protein